MPTDYPAWKSYLVGVSLWTDPAYLLYRGRRLLRRLARRSPAAVAADGRHPAQPPAQRSPLPDSGARGALDGLDVDLVYMWVRGQDPAHQEKRNHWLRQYGLDPAVYNPDVRYVEDDELRYSLRTVELFLPWVRRIFIVTDGQVPCWLDQANRRVRMVDHTEIADKHTLPTFNSSAISAQLHNIPGLAEHFIIANDDTFVGQPCVVGDFFVPLPAAGAIGAKVMISESDDDWITPMHQLTGDPLARLWMGGWNNVKVALELRRPFSRVRRVDMHQMQGMTRSAMASAAREFPREYARTCASRFRNANDMLFYQLAGYHALSTGAARRGHLASRVFRVEEELRCHGRQELPTLFCINGGPGAGAGGEERALQALFPLPSSFERTWRAPYDVLATASVPH